MSRVSREAWVIRLCFSRLIQLYCLLAVDVVVDVASTLERNGILGEVITLLCLGLGCRLCGLIGVPGMSVVD